ncbi:MAG: hypothetical protein ACRC33_09375, partial [Gemmataceae bacterium]
MRPYLPAAALAALSVSVALAQPAQPPSFTMSSLVYLGSPDLHEELKLDAEQMKKATALAEGAMARWLGARTDPDKRAALDKEIEKDLAFLKPDQRKRLREVVIQTMTSRAAGWRAVAADPVAAARLKLTAEQKTKLETGATVGDVLTAGQQKEWKEMLGAPFAGRLVATTALGGGFGRAVALPVNVEYLQAEAVVAELRLTDGQEEKVKALAARWLKEAPAARAAEKQKEAAALEEKLNGGADALLDDAQRKRLGQIRFRQELRGTREHEWLTLPEVADKLGLVAAHRKQIEAASDARGRELLAQFTPDADAADLQGRLAAFHADTAKRLEATLTDGQKERFDDLIGKPFVGRLPVRLALGVAAGGVRVSPPTTLLDRGVRYLGMPGMHKD